MCYSKIFLKKEKFFMGNTYFTCHKGLCPTLFETPFPTNITLTI